MEPIFEGGFKDGYKMDDEHFVLQFKKYEMSDQGVTSYNITEPTEESIKARHSLTTYFYKRLNAIDVPTYFISSNFDKATITVKPITIIGNGISVLCRFPSNNSLRHYDEEGLEIEKVVSISFYEDEHPSHSISKYLLLEKGIISKKEYNSLELLSIDISNFVRTELAKKGIILHEIRLKFGRDTLKEEILLIDEISGQNIVAYQDTTHINTLLLEKILLDK